MNFFDVIIVGAGPAGIASALKCTSQGYNTLLMEKGKPYTNKPCGGIVPTLCADMLEEEFGLKLPQDIMCSPEKLGLFYVPPSGKNNGGSLQNYKLLNLNRALFDQWLRGVAEVSGVKIVYETQFLSFQRAGSVRVLADGKEKPLELECRYLIGADGVSSRVRKQLYPHTSVTTMSILQEHWQARGEFGDNFYVVYKEAITPSYAYLIPKDGLFIIGTGVPLGHPIPPSICLDRFREELHREFNFEPILLEKKEGGAIPYNSLFNGEGDIILIGDAAGFCNPFSGEGIRLAIESGILSGEAVALATNSGTSLSSIYNRQIDGLRGFIQRIYEFSNTLTDELRDKFVSTELKRNSFAQC